MNPLRTILNSAFAKCFWILLALHILNISIDAPDRHADYYAEDLSYNDIESIVEFILESVLGIDNAIAEYDEADESGAIKINKNIDFFFESGISLLVVRQPLVSVFHEDCFYSPVFLVAGAINELFQPPELLRIA